MAGPIEYPSHLYHATRPSQLVTSPTLGARMIAAGWSDTPATFYPPVVAEFDLDPLGLGTDAELAKADAEKKAAEVEAAAATELHNTSAAVIAEMLESVTDIEQLERIRSREARNPERIGGRKGVLAALDARLTAIIEGDLKK